VIESRADGTIYARCPHPLVGERAGEADAR
jgi:hypothetical protein